MTSLLSHAGLSAAELQRLARRIGNTPVQRLPIAVEGIPRDIYLKLECCNPAGSIKDRTADSLIQDLERRHQIGADSTIIESTSGNVGIALAFLCRARGYRFVAIVDPRLSPQTVDSMRRLGADVRTVQHADAHGNYLLARLALVKEFCRIEPHFIWSDQYSNPANPRAHYSTTGPEIFHQLDRHVDAVFVAAGTGGTLAGIGRYFREVSPATRIVGVDAVGSVIFGGAPGPRTLCGIGSARRSSFIKDELYDASMAVADVEAYAQCRQLRTATGLDLGGSSGAVLAACYRYLRQEPTIRRVACVCPGSRESRPEAVDREAWSLATDGRFDVAS